MRAAIFPFSRYNTAGLILSLLVTSTLLLLTGAVQRGFNLGIDFSSGMNITLEIADETSVEELESQLSTFDQIKVTRQGGATGRQYNIKFSSTAAEQEQSFQRLTAELDKNYQNYTVLSTAFIGSTISQSLLNSSLYIVGFALLLMLLYIWVRFKFQFALAAILALLHDALFIVGFIGAFQIEVTVSTVAAVLTIIGYSINDTIVIFDRIRENLLLMRDASFRQITDSGITRTLSRTIITSLTTLLAVFAILLFATGDVQNFSLVLIVGVVEGVWSSIFIATPLLYVFGYHKRLARQPSPAQHPAQRDKGGSVEPPHTGEPRLQSSESQEAKPVSQEYIEKVRNEVRLKKRKKRR